MNISLTGTVVQARCSDRFDFKIHLLVLSLSDEIAVLRDELLQHGKGLIAGG